MAPVEIDPVVLAAAGVTLSADEGRLAAALTTFSASLKGFNAGQDPAGTEFGVSYMTNSAAVIKAACAALKACRQVGFGIQMSAANYSAAEAAATVGGPAVSVAPPVMAAPTPLSVRVAGPFGDGIAKPLLWSVVEFFVGDIWPNGDPGAMREAASAWKTLGQALTGIGTQIPLVKPSITAQDIPEQATMSGAVDDIGNSVTALAGMCSSLAAQLESFAGDVEKAQNAVRDLLKRLSPSGLLDTIGDWLSGESPLDDIKAIANDIKAVLGNLGREADAKVQLIQQAVAALDGLADSVEAWVSKEFPVIAPVVNAMIDFDVGAWKNIIGVVGSVAALNPERFLSNPQGALQAWKGTAEGLAMLTNPALLAAKIASDPHGALEMGKSLIDWDDIKNGHGMRAVGYNAATVASLFIPGAEAAKPAAAAAEAGTRAAQAAGIEARAGTALGRDAAAAARIPGADLAAQTAKISERLDNLPQIRPVEPPRPGAIEAPRPGASITEQPRPTDPGLPAAGPRSEPVTPPAADQPAGAPVGEPRPGAVDPPIGHPPAAPAEVPHGQAPGPSGEPGGQMPPAATPTAPTHTPPPPAEAPPGHAAPGGVSTPEAPSPHGESPAHAGPPNETPTTTHDSPGGSDYGNNVDGGQHQSPGHSAEDLQTPTGDPATAHLPPLRQHYIQDIQERLPALESELRGSGASEAEIAQAMNSERRLIGEEYKNLTPEPLRSDIYGRNEAKYGDPLGPTYETLKAQGKSDAQIIESSKRTGGGDLGLGAK